MIYLYDGTYFGFLSVVYANYYDKRGTEVLCSENSPGIFLDRHQQVVTDGSKARRVEKALYEKCGLSVVNIVYYAFHSREPNKDTWLLRFVEKAFQMGAAVETALSEPAVMRVFNLAKRVSRERHSFLGFVRFEEIKYGQQNYLYAKIEPENDILELMGEHFSDRFYHEKIVIHDIGRKTALIAYQGEWEIRPFAIKDSEIRQHHSDKERSLQKLWQGYFDTIAIEERSSQKRQKQFVPLKYRKNLTEFQATKQSIGSCLK
ncbi:DNA metabolism protein [Clostridiales bacterium COT073_COT-073]|nr:DNA metabolism protein [Clostridiales bacterium COT073_COT-073]